MADTTFTNGVTLTDADWFNDVNRLHYTIFGDPANLASAQAAFFSAGAISLPSTLSVSGAATFAGITVGGVISTSATAQMQGLNVAGTLSISAGVAGAAVATQANMESAISAGSTSLIVTPGRVQYHPGVAKVVGRFDGTATSVTAAAGSYNIGSITDKGTGNYNVIFGTAFSGGSLPSPQVTTNLNNWRLVSVSTASVEIITLDLSGTAADASIVTVAVFGDQ